MKLLIVDDQSTVVQGLLHCTNWAAMGFTVVDTALNAVDAKASLLRQEAEVMLCDIEMPMESGLDLLDWLRQRGMTTRCIFLTAHAEFRYAQEALRLGGFDYIMQPAPYEQVADAVSRALENVKEERAALELQSRGAVFDDQKKEIVETMLRGFLLGNAPGSSLTAFGELSLVPRQERECWVALMQPLRWKQGEEPWELSLLSTAVGNMSSEVFTPLQVLSVTVAIPAEQCLVLVLQSRVEEPLEADYITRQLPAAGCLFFRLPAVRRSQQLRRSLVRTGKDPHRPPEDLAGGGQLCRTAPARELRERNQDHDGTGTKCPSERTAAAGEPEGKADQAGAVPPPESLCKERSGGVCRFQPDGTVSAV